jgi:16S rRNA (guanine1516-N2)-methyltransferase
MSVSWQNPENQSRAESLAQQLGLPLVAPSPLQVGSYQLQVGEDIELLMRTQQGISTLHVDFVKGSIGYRRRHGGGLKQSIAKAVGLKHAHEKLSVIDATAGLGRDAFILASLGCRVHLIERSPIIAILLLDGLERALKAPHLVTLVQERMQLTVGDALDILSTLPSSTAPQVVYLDPMFPGHNRRALTKIDMRIIRDIVGPDLDSEKLLAQALQVACQRVVVKRPSDASALKGPSPTFVIEGKNHRYDVYLTQGSK